MDKKIKTLLVIGLIVFVITLAINSKVNALDEHHTAAPSQLQKDFNYLSARYGPEIAKIVEKIYRLETRHFKSEQYLNSFSAGMLAFTNSYPYGWNSPLSAWNAEPELKPIGIYPMTVNGKVYNYIKFKTPRAGMVAVAEHIKKYGRAGRWNSTDPNQMSNYENALEGVRTEYT